MEYLHNYDLEDNHRLAAEKLVKKLGWRGDWYMGGIPNKASSMRAEATHMLTYPNR